MLADERWEVLPTTEWRAGRAFPRLAIVNRAGDGLPPRVVCLIESGGEETARLIAKAPVLLNLCRAVLDAWSDWATGGQSDPDLPHHLAEVIAEGFPEVIAEGFPALTDRPDQEGEPATTDPGP